MQKETVMKERGLKIRIFLVSSGLLAYRRIYGLLLFSFSLSSGTFVKRQPSSSLLLSRLELSDAKSVSLEYEPASEPLHIYVQ